MELEARGIIIYKSVELADELTNALLPEIKLLDLEVRRTLLKGVQAFRESDFDVCFISDSYPLEELKPFFSDVKALKGEKKYVFVQVRDSLGEGIQRNSLASAGFATIISHKVTDGDKAAIADSLVELLKEQEIRRRRVDVESAMNLIMLEVDRVAKDRKRGIDRQFSRDVLAGFVDDQLDFHSEVMESYLKAIDNLSDKGAPMKELIVSLPQKFIAKNLPGIEKGEYAGASLRVWEMLREKFGREKGDVTDVVEIDASEPKEAEEDRAELANPPTSDETTEGPE